MALSGVLSSWLMLARNCDLCRLASASSRLFSSMSAKRRACSIAMTHCAAKVSRRPTVESGNAPGSRRRTTSAPTMRSGWRSGMTSAARKPASATSLSHRVALVAQIGDLYRRTPRGGLAQGGRAERTIAGSGSPRSPRSGARPCRASRAGGIRRKPGHRHRPRPPRCATARPSSRRWSKARSRDRATRSPLGSPRPSPSAHRPSAPDRRCAREVPSEAARSRWRSRPGRRSRASAQAHSAGTGGTRRGALPSRQSPRLLAKAA